jgi:hypothetical protein
MKTQMLVPIRRGGGLCALWPAVLGLLLLLPLTVPAQLTLDFGDAPAVYPTLLPNGARHVVGPLFLGNLVDVEANGQPSVAANGDDLNPPMAVDDEDGVFITSAFISGVPGTLRVVSSGLGFLQGWVDFNADGDWADVGEQIVLNFPVVAGVNIVPYQTPVFQASGTGVVTYARFRLAAQQNLPDNGLASGGEVEDYAVVLAPLKWLQPPNLTTNGVDVSTEFELADDFLCTFTGPITDIHIWGSFREDYEEIPLSVLTNLSFLLKIYSDVPVGPGNPYSHPGNQLWQMSFAPGSFQAGRCAFISQPGEWWHTPPGFWQPGADWYCYQFDFFLKPEEAFRQSVSNVYWLSVKCLSPYWFGWKSTPLTNRWNDDAVWFDTQSGIPMWRELRYGDGHPYALPPPGHSLDLAFALSTEETEEPVTLDFGDAPDPAFPTRLASNGARHAIVPNVRLGLNLDAEADGQPNLTATGDDLAGPVNDEDGVTYVGTMIPGQTYPVTVAAAVNGFLNAWVDFGADQSWAQPGDQIFTNQPLVAGLNALVFNVPATAAWGTNVFARFRFTTATNNLGYVGLAPDGEVEDHRMTMEPFPQHDLGDAPASLNNFSLPMTAYPAGGPAGVIANFPTALVFPGPVAPAGPIHLQPTNLAYLGARVTFESNADLGSDQDLINNLLPATDKPDLDGADDGLGLPLVLPHCGNGVLSYIVTFTALPPPGTNLFANIWFDWNRDGDWNDVPMCPDGTAAAEWAVQNQPVMIPPGPFPATTLMTAPPFRALHPALTRQPIWMRLTLAEQMWPPVGVGVIVGGAGPTNGYAYGETEDYYLTTYDLMESYDFGDAPAPGFPTLLAGNGARHRTVAGFQLGALLDAESDGQPNALATGDDTNSVADEDGVTFTTPALLGTQACVNVTVQAGGLGGLLDAWLDFDGNGVWTAGEQIFVSQPVSAGANPGLCYTVPATAKLGPTFARFRLSSVGALAPAGATGDGEVEDYWLTLRQARPATNLVITGVQATNITVGTNLGQVVTVWWTSLSNLHCQLQAVTNFTGAPTNLNWFNVGTEVIGPANSQSETNLPPTGQRYYRVFAPYTWP